MQSSSENTTWRLDRLGRSLRHLLDLVEQLHSREVGLRSLTEQFNTTSAGGRLIFSVFGAVAEFEHAIIVERTQAGLAAARARGRVGGRPPALTARQRHAAQQLRAAGHPVREIAGMFGVQRSTIYRCTTVPTPPAPQIRP